MRIKLASLLVLPSICLLFVSAVAQSQAPRRTLVHSGSTSIAVTIRGQGEPVLFVPSRGRGVEDFDDLSKRLVDNGYQAILPEPRGIGGSIGPLEDITYHDLASDLAATIHAVVGAPATVIGHDFGGRIARTLASDHPRLVKQVVLIGAAGKVRRSTEMERLTTRFWETALPTEDRLAILRQAFFAPGHDAGVWQDGWHFDIAKAQRASDSRTPLDEWWAGGTAPMLVIYGAEDQIAVPANAKSLATEFPHRVTLVEISKAGHAMLPEQPAQLAEAVLAYLRRKTDSK